MVLGYGAKPHAELSPYEGLLSGARDSPRVGSVLSGARLIRACKAWLFGRRQAPCE